MKIDSADPLDLLSVKDLSYVHTLRPSSFLPCVLLLQKTDNVTASAAALNNLLILVIHRSKYYGHGHSISISDYVVGA